MDKIWNAQNMDASDKKIDVAETADLMFSILKSSMEATGDNVLVEENGSRKSLITLVNECNRRMEKLSTAGQKGDFLVMAALENTFTAAYPALAFSIQEELDGNAGMLEKVHSLKQIFKDDPYKKIWTEKVSEYRKIQEMLGLKMSDTGNLELNQYVDPLIDAFTFYEEPNLKVYKVREGRTSALRPEIAGNIAKYRSEREFVSKIAACGKESVLAFGAVEKTFLQTTDFFSEWYYGYPEERMRNWMRNTSTDRQTFLSMDDQYSRCVYLCIKSAETIWLVPMPYKTEYSTAEIKDGSSKYVYGSRAGYAPYEIFYRDLPPAPDGTAFLTLQSGGYRLNDLMDDESKIWFPAFVEETWQHFFQAQPESKEMIFPEEVSVYCLADPGEKDQLSLHGTEMSACTLTYHLPKPEEMFTEDYLLRLFQYFGITERDIASAPISPFRFSSREEDITYLDEHTRKAYLKVLAERIADLLGKEMEKCREETVLRIFQDRERIMNELVSGKLDAFSSVIVDGETVKDEDGNPVVIKESRYPYRETVSITHTVRDDGRGRTMQELMDRLEMPAVFWLSDGVLHSGNKPPVLWKLQPRTAEQYSALLGIPEAELEPVLQLSGDLDQFYREYERTLPNALTNRYFINYHTGEVRSVYLPHIGDVNICMTKRDYKRILKARKGLQ